MKRTELIHHLMESTDDGLYVKKAIRGKDLWIIREKEGKKIIVCYLLNKNPDGSWTYKTEYETTPPSSITCPDLYLTETAVLCEDWRKAVRTFWKRRNGTRIKIRRMFKIAKKENKRLFVELAAKKEYTLFMCGTFQSTAILEIVSIDYGIKGRLKKTGLLYAIPSRLVKRIFFEKKGEER